MLKQLSTLQSSEIFKFVDQDDNRKYRLLVNRQITCDIETVNNKVKKTVFNDKLVEIFN